MLMLDLLGIALCNFKDVSRLVWPFPDGPSCFNAKYDINFDAPLQRWSQRENLFIPMFSISPPLPLPTCVFFGCCEPLVSSDGLAHVHPTNSHPSDESSATFKQVKALKICRERHSHWRGALGVSMGAPKTAINPSPNLFTMP